MSTSDKQNKSGAGIWVAIVILFGVGLWPIALVLLVRELMGWGKKKRTYTTRPRNAAGQFVSTRNAAAPGTAGAAATVRTAGSGLRKGGLKFPDGKGLTIAGGVVSGIFGLSTMIAALEFLESLMYGYFFADELAGVLVLLGFLALGLVLLFCGLAKKAKGKRFRKYLGLIGRRKAVSLTAMARTTGIKRHTLLDDLQDMLDDGFLPAGYLDLLGDQLVLSEEGIPDEAPKPKAAPKVETPQDDNAILTQIRQVNDAIPDPVMSAKIDRIGEITGRILDYQRKNPGKDSQLRSFLNYYLPTTLKILNSYAQLDAQGVEGENISAAKARIEGMMDKVVEGFESQLDKLFADSAMDISSDVAVLEQMLEKDGLSNSGQGMTMGM